VVRLTQIRFNKKQKEAKEKQKEAKEKE